MPEFIEGLESRRFLSAGQLDPSFINGGITDSDWGGNARDSLVLPDGKILVLADSGPWETPTVVARFNSNGRLDRSFGDAGIASPLASDALPIDFALQSDGRIVVLMGTRDLSKISVTRFNFDGSIDASFGGEDGIELVPGAGRGNSQSLAIAANDKIIVGTTANHDFIISRLNANGTRDTSFGNGNSFRQIDFGGASPSDDALAGIALDAAGKIVSAGVTTLEDGRSGFAAARLNANGSFDSTFHGGHVYQIDPNLKPLISPDRASSSGAVMGLLSDGSVQIAATGLKGTVLDLHVARFTRRGAIDTTFGKNGIVASGPSFNPFDAEIQADGKMLLGGADVLGYDPQWGDPPFGSASVLRLQRNGSLDKTFQLDSRVWGMQATGISIQPDQKIIVGSMITFIDAGGARARVVRVLNDAAPPPPRAGKADTSFGNLGASLGNWAQDAGDPVVLADGKILVAGTLRSEDKLSSVAVARFNPNGSLDTTFANRGVTTPINWTRGENFWHDVSARDLAIQSDGKIILAFGTSDNTTRLARFNPDGVIDESFGGRHAQEHSIPVTHAGLSGAQSLVIAPNNKILVGTSVLSALGDYDFVVSRLKANGTSDRSFATGRSYRRIDIASFSQDFLAGIALAPNGKIIVAGLSGIHGQWSYSATRLNPDGFLDPTFHRGRAHIVDPLLLPPTPIETSSGWQFTTANLPAVMALLPDGRIEVAALSQLDTANPDLRLARFTARGLPDRTFGSSAIVSTGQDLAPHDAQLQADGKLLLAGARVGEWITSQDAFWDTKFWALRLTTAGNLDPTFQLANRFLGQPFNASGVALTADNKIILAGSLYVGDFVNGDGVIRAVVARLFNDA